MITCYHRSRPSRPSRRSFLAPTNDPARPLDHIAFTVPYNMSEQPAASINCGYTEDGLPIGLQIAGRRFDDVGVLQICRWYRGSARAAKALAEAAGKLSRA